ncbi:MAG TPA: SpoIIE family protein phosphatase [Actinomycetota bacterium]|nr:SpoIIE family protein phosphatase [Actinomycetota bacterium]
MPDSPGAPSLAPAAGGPGSTLSPQDLLATLHAVTDSITVQGPGGQLLWANEAAARQLGFDSPAELLAAPLEAVMERFTMLDEDGNPLPIDSLPGRIALSGKQAPETLVQWRNTGSDDVHWSLVRAMPVFDDRGEVRFAVNVFRDDTSRQVAIQSLRSSEERLAFLALASRVLLGASLDPLEIAERLTEVCVPRVGDLCAVWEFRSGRIRRIAERVEGAVPGARTLEETPESVAAAEAGEATLDEGQDESGVSSVTVPIPGRHGPLGAILVARRLPGHPMTQTDLHLVQEVGRRAGVAIENALLYEERARAAEVLSRSLVPAELPEVPGLDLYGFVRAAASGVGGDFYDIVELADGRSLLLIADVCGKGPEAAALTAMARYTLRTLSRHYASPAEVLQAVNEALVDQLPDGRFCSLACGAFGPAPNGVRATVVVAGHPKPVILRSGGTLETCGETGFPLGVVSRLQLPEHDVVLEPGDAFLMVTDGCVGEGGVWEPVLHTALTSSPTGSAAEIGALVEKVALGVQPDHPDDIAALVARFPGAS